MTGLINVALGKAARQSSVSGWSHEDDANHAVSGVMPDDFAFHTDWESNPWWEVDLGGVFAIELIVIHNRLGPAQERAHNIKVEVANDLAAPQLVHAGFANFGGGEGGHPLTLRLGGSLRARYVRLSLEAANYFHLAQVEVLVRPEMLAVEQFVRKNNLTTFDIDGRGTATHYEIAQNPERSGNEVIGLRIDRAGRFGNLLHQYANAIILAERTGLKCIQAAHGGLMNIIEPFEEGGITFLPPESDLPVEGFFISGEFFNSDDFQPLMHPFLQFDAPDEEDLTRTIQKYVLPQILDAELAGMADRDDDELTIHLRSGDVFGEDHPIVYGYRQPPLSFYILVIEKMRKERGVNRIRLIFEDRGNPCIDALETWLNARSMPFSTQQGDLKDDIAALLNAPHLIFGHGTFGYAICRLSKQIKTVHYFAPELGGCYAHIPTIEEVYSVADAEGGYIKAFETGKPFDDSLGWRNTPELRQKMLDYPIRALSLKQVKPRPVQNTLSKRIIGSVKDMIQTW